MPISGEDSSTTSPGTSQRGAALGEQRGRGDAQLVPRDQDRRESRGRMDAQIRALAETGEKLRTETGALVTALLITIGKMAIGIYIGRSGIASSYGAAGAVLASLLWIYYSAQIFLLGAEFTKAYASNYGSMRHTKAAASVAEASGDAVPPA